MRFIGGHVLSVLFGLVISLSASKATTQDEVSNKDVAYQVTSQGASQADSSVASELPSQMTSQVASQIVKVAHNPPGEHNLWPDGTVPYEFEHDYSVDMRQQVLAAMAAIEDQTCVRWVTRTRADPTYVLFMVGHGCYSLIGRSPQAGPQDLSLNPDQGCLHHSVVVHELMHALGFGHEQNRWDRDEYVIVHLDRVKPDMINNFKKDPRPLIPGWERFPYELDSVMHYERNFFGIKRGDTMEPRVPGTKMGNRVGMTEMDVKQINYLYDCDGKTRVGEKRGDVMPSADEVWRNITLHVSVLEKAFGNAATSDATTTTTLLCHRASCVCVLLVVLVGWRTTYQPTP